MKKAAIIFAVLIMTALTVLGVGCTQSQASAPQTGSATSASKVSEQSTSDMSAKELETTYPLSNQMHKGLGLKCSFCHGEFNSADEIKDTVPNEKCLSCHISYEEVAKQTSDLGDVNPHDNFHYDMQLDCVTCHKGHEKSTNFCSNCHDAELWMNETP